VCVCVCVFYYSRVCVCVNLSTKPNTSCPRYSRNLTPCQHFNAALWKRPPQRELERNQMSATRWRWFSFHARSQNCANLLFVSPCVCLTVRPSVRINVTFRRVRVTITAIEMQ